MNKFRLRVVVLAVSLMSLLVFGIVLLNGSDSDCGGEEHPCAVPPKKVTKKDEFAKRIAEANATVRQLKLPANLQQWWDVAISATEQGSLDGRLSLIDVVARGKTAPFQTVWAVQRLIEFTDKRAGQEMRNMMDRYVDKIFQREIETEWGKIRARMWQIIDAGRMNVPAHKQWVARETLRRWRGHQSRTAWRIHVEGGGPLTPQQTEALFGEYVKSNANMAALWGFGVIALFDEPRELDKYAIGARSRGHKPYQGYLLYMDRTGYQSRAAAEKWVNGDKVGDAIDRICPV